MSEWRKICCKHCGKQVDFTEMEIKAIQNTRNEWIPVSERLPDSGQDVLFYDGTVKKGYFDDFNNIDKTKGKFFWELDPTNFHSCPDNNPTHWQPIRPPKGE